MAASAEIADRATTTAAMAPSRVYTYDDILWHCSHVQASAEVIALVKEALRPNKIEKPQTARITGLLNKVTPATFRKLLPDIINAVEQERANGLKLLEHACLNADFMNMYLDMLTYVTYKDQLAAWFMDELRPFVERLHTELAELDLSDYDVFCMTQKKLRSLHARLRLLQLFVASGFLGKKGFMEQVDLVAAHVTNVDMLLTLLGALDGPNRPGDAVARLLAMGEELSFKYKFKIEELMKGAAKCGGVAKRR